MADLVVREFNSEGELVTTSHKFYPVYLDWMDIKVKAHWYQFVGDGDPRTKYALLESQGQQLLIEVENLAMIDHKTYKEIENGAREEVDRFIVDGGYSRTPRNQ